MTVSYLWNCTRVDAYPVEGENPDVVYNVHWNLTPFESLTNVVVTDWVIAAMGPEAVEALELSIFNMIEEQVNPTSISLIIGQPIPPTD